MAAGALKDDEALLPVNLIDEQPVGAEVAFPAALPGADKVMVLKLRGQALPGQKAGQHRLQGREVVLTPAQTLQIPLELSGISRIEHQSFRR